MNDFRNIYIIDKEIERIKGAMDELRAVCVSASLKEAYEHLLAEQMEELLQAKLDAEQKLNEIQDETARLIAKMRFIDLKSWSEIGKFMNYDRTVVYRKLKKAMKHISS